jgi:branched-subunit amino acid ABC-type transport system permease component
METKYGQTIIINPSNAAGTAGFVFALFALFVSAVPVFGWILWIPGLILSFVGVFNSPKGFAVTGLIISVLDLYLLLTVGRDVWDDLFPAYW